ncbi:MAG: diguanylate cyclase [Acidobacteria bacterium]|nr:MAG: diguanylate cyclase [Acidobacteriota bacterium]
MVPSKLPCSDLTDVHHGDGFKVLGHSGSNAGAAGTSNRRILKQTMAISIQQLKIRDQVLILVLPLLFALVGIIALFFYNYWQVGRITVSAQNRELAAMRADSLLQGTSQMSEGVRGYVLTGRQLFLDDYNSALASVFQDFVVLREIESDVPLMAPRVENIRKSVEDWKKTWADPLIEKVKAGRSSEATVAMLQGSEEFVGIQTTIRQFRGANQAAAAENRDQSQRIVHSGLISGAVLVGVFALLLAVLVHVISRNISNPVLQLTQASDRLRQGDFDLMLPPETDNEFGVLTRSFLHMSQSLRRDREELAAIKRFSESVTECTSESEVYDQILHAFRDRFNPAQVIIFKLRPEEDFLEVVASLHPLPTDVHDWPVIEGKNSCKAVRMGRPFRVNDVTVEPLCPGRFALPEDGSYYCGPLIAGGIIIGAIRLQGIKGFWTPERESLLESYLSTTASVLSNLQLLQTMREQANIDPLTGLYNRRFCKDYARKLMAMARRKDTSLGFLILDLDHFKNINDVYGHEIGDRVLKLFAKTITQSMRETNLTARLGGEEFVVILPDTGAKACQVVAERIRNAVALMNMPQVNEKPLPSITVSLGIAVYPEHGSTLEEMLQASDRALYESKRAGRNRATLYVAEIERRG